MCRFRRLLERHDLGCRLLEAVHRHLEAKGLKVSTGTMVDATIIDAPSSSKNADKARDPDMHQTKKGNQWYFGMKAHVGVGSRTKINHAVVATAANWTDGFGGCPMSLIGSPLGETSRSTKNMVIVRHFAINLVRDATDKKSIKLRRKVAGWDTKYLASILGLQAR